MSSQTTTFPKQSSLESPFLSLKNVSWVRGQPMSRRMAGQDVSLNSEMVRASSYLCGTLQPLYLILKEGESQVNPFHRLCIRPILCDFGDPLASRRTFKVIEFRL